MKAQVYCLIVGAGFLISAGPIRTSLALTELAKAVDHHQGQQAEAH